MYRGDDGGRVHVMVTAFAKLSRMQLRVEGGRGSVVVKGYIF